MSDLPPVALSLAAPAYNEAASIGEVVEQWIGHLRNLPSVESFEIVVANDGSRDATGELLEDLARRFPEVRPVHLSVNRGAAAALASAIRQTRLAWVLLIDSDGQFPIENLDAMLATQAETGSLAVHGVRRGKKASAFARVGSWLSGGLCNWILGTCYRDFNCALTLVEGPLLRDLALEARGLNYSTEIMARLIERGVSLGEVDILHQARPRGASSMKLLRDAAHRLLFVAYVAFRTFLFRVGVLDRMRWPR